MRTHTLKTWPEFFERLKSGEKRFELRRNDRDFQVGDDLLLMEWIPPWRRGPLPNAGHFTGRYLRARILYALTQTEGIVSGYAILSIEIRESS